MFVVLIFMLQYVGTLTDGTEFDSSTGKKPLTFTLGSGQVIKGWDSGLLGKNLLNFHDHRIFIKYLFNFKVCVSVKSENYKFLQILAMVHNLLAKFQRTVN